MTEYMQNKNTGVVRELLGRYKDPSTGQRYLWLKSDNNGPSTYHADSFEDYVPPKEPKTNETWRTSMDKDVQILDHTTVSGVHVFAYRFIDSVSDNVHIRVLDKQIQDGWRKL